MSRLVIISLFAACAAAGCWLGARPAPITSTPPVEVVARLCEAFEAEGDDAMSFYVINRTRSVYQTFALRVHHRAGALTPTEADQDNERDRALGASFEVREVRLPRDELTRECRWRLISQPAAVPEHSLILELSNVVRNPFAEPHTAGFGIFARLSLAGSLGASWYWVPLLRAGREWEALPAVALEISDG
jgi:hypothetical protein